MAKIIVFGASGNIGYEVAKALAAKGVSFKAVVHSDEKANKVKSLGSGIEIIKVDVRDQDAIVAACTGVDKVFFMTPPMDTAAGHGMAEAMKKAGVKHIVKLSAAGQEHEDFEWAYYHRGVEDTIRKLGIPLTSLNPTSFYTNIFNDIQTIKNQGVIYKALDDVKINHISHVDIGEVAAVALTEPGHEGKSYYLYGDSNITCAELAKKASIAFGKEVKYVPIDDATLRKNASAFLPPQVVDGLSNMFTYYRTKGGYDREQNGDVEKVLKRKPKSLDEYLVEVKPLFT